MIHKRFFKDLKIIIPEQFTVNAHPALFGERGRRRRGGKEPKKGTIIPVYN